MIRVRAPQAALLAIPFGVAGFALAGTLLAASVTPTAWNPVVDPNAAASVTDVGGQRVDESSAMGREYFFEFQTQATYGLEREVAPVPTISVPPRIDGELGIPQIVLDAYRSAESRRSEADPSCQLRWQILAGIGKVESGHADNGLVYADGTTFNPILGPVLDGGDYAAIPDSDDGIYDGDTVWDRAVGPMQFIPGTWAAVGVDGNDDGLANPHNVFDAALAAGAYLCVGSTDLGVRAGLERALLRYNHSVEYVALVLAWIDGYTAGQVTPLPPRPTPPPTTDPTTGPPTSPPASTPPTSTPPTSTTPVTTTPAIVPPTTPPTTSAETTSATTTATTTGSIR